jgi:ferredoxin/flavodoxin---NADP+ reductase
MTIAVRPISEETFVLCVKRDGVAFKPGQHVSLGVPGTALNREYSIYSGDRDETLDFLIRRMNKGSVSTVLSKLKPGDPLELNGPFGEFCLKEKFKTLPHFLIATGTGIAPFHSFVSSYPQLDYHIFHGVRFEHETYEHQHYEMKRYTPCLSQSKSDPQRVTDLLSKTNLPRDAVFYLCGNSAMLNDAYDILRDKRIPSDHIFTEAFF